jgi:hypothetical protein
LCAPRANPSFEVQQFRVGCVVQLSHRLSSFAQRRADAVTHCAGHKKARSDPPGRDTHSYDDGLNTQDSVTRVNSFFAFVSHTEHALICNIVRMERLSSLEQFQPHERRRGSVMTTARFSQRPTIAIATARTSRE